MKLRAAIRRLPAAARNTMRDLRYGAFLGGTTENPRAHLGAYAISNSDYRDLDELFAQIEIAHDDVIVDVGCGKGRVLNWFLARHPGNAIYGIELDPDVCERTKRRLRRFANVTVSCGDATESLPREGTLFYLFNPFDAEVMRRFADTFLAAEPSAGQPRRIVYYNCKHVDVFLTDERFEVRSLERPRVRSALIRPRQETAARSPSGETTPSPPPT